jgi:protein phosphatase
MAEIILGSDTNPGGRKYNEDRCGFETLTTRGGQTLAVAVVCDGVGGEERGERAAQLAVDTFIAHLRESEIAETPRLLYNAVKMANLAAYNEAQRLNAGERMACTMVAAVIENGDKLYIANVGDSRIYLSRDGQLRQLTRDHTFENVMVWMGKLSPEAAAANPDANKVMRVLGTKSDIQADLGFYLNTTDYGNANRIGRDGLTLKPGDSVLLCTDGLIKPTATTGQPLVMDKEIVRILETEEGPKAARAIMSIALGRIPVGEQVDNITLILAQTEDPNRAVNQARLQRQQEDLRRRETSRKMMLIAAAVGIPMCVALVLVLGAFFGFFNFVMGSNAETATRLAEATQIALAQTATVEAYTPTPTVPPPTNTPVPTIPPTLAAGEIGKLFRIEELLEVLIDDRKMIDAPADETRFVAVNHKVDQGDTGNIHLANDSRLQLLAVTDPRFQLRIFSESDLFFQTGPYANGADIELEVPSILTKVKGCLATFYLNEDTLTASCFSGECSYSLDFGADFTTIAAGQQVKIDIEEPAGSPAVDIPKNDHYRYFDLLKLTSAGREDIRRCNVQARPTPTPTRPPTATPNVGATAECQRLQQLGTPCP